MNPYELNLAIAAYATALAANMTPREMTWWGIVFSHLGENLTNIAALKELDEDSVGPLTETGGGAAESERNAVL